MSTLNTFWSHSCNEFEHCRCVDVTGAYSSQKTELNISLTAIGLLWTTTDFIAKGLKLGTEKEMDGQKPEEQTLSVLDQATLINVIDHDKLLFSVFSLLQNLGADERPEVGRHVLIIDFHVS